MVNSLRMSEIFSAIKQRRSLIAVLALIIFGITIGVIQVARPSYRAEALVEVTNARRSVPGNESAAPVGGDASTVLATVNTEVSRLDADPIARVVYGKLGRAFTDAQRSSGPIAALRSVAVLLCGRIPTPAWFHSAACAPEVSVETTDGKDRGFEKFHGAFTIEAVRGSRVIRISAAAPDPALASTMANALAEIYIKEKADEATGQNAMFIAWLEERMAQVAEQATQSSEAVANYRQANNLIELAYNADTVQHSPITEQLSGQLHDLASAVSAKAQAEVRLAQMRDLRANPRGALSSTEVVGSETIRDLYKQENAADQRLAELSSYNSQYPQKRAVIAELDGIHNQIKAQAGRVLEAANQDYARASAVVEQLTKEVARQQNLASQEQMNRVKLGDLERRARVANDLHAAYLQSTQAAIERSTWHEANVRLIANAVPPERPTFPNRRLMLPLGLVASLSFASLAGLVFELRRHSQSFVDPVDLEETTGLHVRGVIPSVRRPTAFPAPRDLILAVEDIGMRLLFRGARRLEIAGQKPGRVIAITSSSQGDGKSMLSLGVARWLTGHGVRTLLLNADMRRPSILREAVGTVAVPPIEGPAWAPELPLHMEASSRLTILSLDEVRADPVAIIATIEEILAPLRKIFEFIVIDLPPVLAVADALNVVPHADQTLFVVRWAATRRRSVLYALDRFDAADRARTELVFSRVESKSYRRYELPGAERYGAPHGRRYGAFPQQAAAQLAQASRKAGRRAHKA